MGVLSSARCPSRGFDARLDQQERPEVCFVCRKPNADEETGEPLCGQAPDFCSLACQDKYLADMKVLDDAEAKDLAMQEKLLREHNAKCPKCKGKTRYCVHQD